MSSISRARYLCPTAAVPKHRNPIIVRRRCCQRKAGGFSDSANRRPPKPSNSKQSTHARSKSSTYDFSRQPWHNCQRRACPLKASKRKLSTHATSKSSTYDFRRQPWHTVTRRDCPVYSTPVHAFARCWTIVVVASLVVDTVARRRKATSLGQSLRQRFATARDTSQTPRLSKVRCQTTQLGPLTLCRGMTSHDRPTAAAPRRATRAKRVRERDAILVRRHFPEAL